MALFQIGSKERELVVEILIAGILFIRSTLLKFCKSQKDAEDLKRSFPEILRVACEGADARLKE